MTSLNHTSVLPSSTSAYPQASFSSGAFIQVLPPNSHGLLNSSVGDGSIYYDYVIDAPGNLSFTIQDALNFGANTRATEDDYYLCQSVYRLPGAGCPYGGNTGNGTGYNCSHSCVHGDQIFNDTATIASCMAYAAISTVLTSCNVNEDFDATAKAYGISANRTLADNVISTMQTCFRDFCQASRPCTDYNASTNGRPYLAGSDYANDSLYYDGITICDAVVAPVLTDIAGIGIYISYLLQSGIALVAFALLKLFDFWVYYIVLAALIWRRGPNRAHNAAHTVRKTARERALPRLAAALVEFHKSQCYFMLAVQIAAMVTISRGQLEPINLQQLYNNWEVVHVVSISGFLPVTLVLLCLHSVGKKSWYLTNLSIVTVGVSIGTLFMTGGFSPSSRDMSYLAGQSSTIQSCGYFDPSVYCLERYMEESALGSDSANNILIFCILILVFIVIDLLSMLDLGIWHRIEPILERYKAYQVLAKLSAGAQLITCQSLDTAQGYLTVWKDSLSPNSPRFAKWLLDMLGALFMHVRNEWQNITLYVLYAIVWSYYIFFFSELLSYYAIFMSGGRVSFVWNFGQIVGITVWAEPFVEYAYLELKGMTAANYRFLPPWALVNMQTTRQRTEEVSRENIELAPSSSGRKISRTDSLASARSGYKDSYEYDEIHRAGDDDIYTDTMAQGLVSKPR